MRTRTVFNWIHAIVTLCLLLTVAGFFWLNQSADYREDDTLMYSHEIGPHCWLYVTQNNSGGATVATLFRYFLSDRITGSPEKIATGLRRRTPFLQGNGTLSAITAQPQGYQIGYSGDVLSLQRSTSFTVEGKSQTLYLNYQIR